MDNKNNTIVRAHIFISGFVQGVFFRFKIKELAYSKNIVGFVKNLEDGRVEGLFEGSKKEIDEMIEFCKKGPPGADVKKVEVYWEDYSGEFKNFKIE